MGKSIYDRKKSKPRKLHSEETRAKMRESMKGKHTGNKAATWKGGIYADRKKYHRDYARNRLRQKREKQASRPRPDNCEICGIPGSMLKKGLAYDHDHKTNQFRGWICGRCNVALGNVKDNTQTLLAMIEYLNKNTI